MEKKLIMAVLMLIVMPATTFAGERISLGYIYNSSLTHSQIVENTKDSVNVVAPTCFDLKSNGRLSINSLITKDFVEEMHSKNISVTPFLSNHWARKSAKKALDNPELLASDIVLAIEEYNLDGVNVDIENITIDYKDKLTNFVKILREKMPSGKTLSVAVAANPENLESTWIATYDYENLAKYADYLMLMAYDEHCQGGAPGPVASIDFVEKSIQNILEKVSKDKVVLGIPLYGRFWKEGAETGGEAIVIGCVENIIKKFKIVPFFDETTMTPVLKVEIDDVFKNAFVNGRYLEAGTYNIWYENENSIKAKLKLINKYNLLGAGLWALDNENENFWNFYKDYLNETKYESENEIRIRKRKEAYKKIVKIKPIVIKYEMPCEKHGINAFKEETINEFKNLATKRYDILECFDEKFYKFSVVKVRKLLLKTYSEKHINLKQRICA